MIYLAFADLMNGVSSLFRGIRGYELVGADSSLAASVRQDEERRRIHQGKTDLGSVALSELAACVSDERLDSGRRIRSKHPTAHATTSNAHTSDCGG